MYIMLWHGSINSQQIIKNKIKNIKKKLNKKKRINGFNLFQKVNLNLFKLFFYIPLNWNLTILKLHKKNLKNNLFIYLYSIKYFFYIPISKKIDYFIYDKNISLLFFNFKNNNSFYATYWFILKNIFYSFSTYFFKKLKFKGKGYYIFKNYRNTIALQFGYSHKVYIYNYYLSVKFLSKTSVLLFGLNKTDLISKSFELFYIRSYNIFTSKGIRFSKQIIYKKIGKISSYR